MSKFKQTFIQGTIILLTAGLINRLLGFVPRIVLPRFIGAEGVGLYQMGYPFLIVLLTITTGGIPLAVAKLVAEAESAGNEKRVRSILQVSLALTSGLSLLFFIVSLIAAPWITSHIFTDKRVYLTFICMTPVILLVGVSSVLRGYFQGRQNMIPTAISQITETLVRIVAVLVFAYFLLPFGIEYAAAGAMLGVVAGELGGLLVLLYQYLASRNQYRRSMTVRIGTVGAAGGRLDALLRLISLTVPVTASRLVGSFSYLFESILLIHCLAAAGIATALATSQYGALQGMIIPIILLPSAITYSLSISLVPALSEAAARNDMVTIHKRLRQALKLALVSGAPFSVFMYILAEPICYYLYKNSEIGVMLKMMAPTALFIYFQAPLQAALQALNKPGTALIHTFIGSAIKLVIIYVLASQPKFGILGAIMAININTIVVSMLHWSRVSQFLNFRMHTPDYFKIGLAMLITGITTYMTMNFHWVDNLFIRFLFALLVGSIVYLLSAHFMNLFQLSELRRMIQRSLRR